jgi:tetratricopeptide (TPR) repeat protein
MFEIHYQFVNDYYNSKNDIDDDRVSKEDRKAFEAYKRAIEDFSAAISLDPANAAFYKSRGETHNEGNFGKSEEAINDYGKAIDLDPNDIDAYIKRGETYANRKEIAEAREDYNRAIKVDPDNPKLWYKRGCIQEADLKIADLSKAIELDPAYADAYNERANMYFDKANYFQNDDSSDEKDETRANRYNDLAMADYAMALSIRPYDLPKNTSFQDYSVHSVEELFELVKPIRSKIVDNTITTKDLYELMDIAGDIYDKGNKNDQEKIVNMINEIDIEYNQRSKKPSGIENDTAD